VSNFKTAIANSFPFAYIIRKSKSTPVPGCSGFSVYNVIKNFFQQTNKIGFTERAAAISFNLIQALPAMLLFLFSLVPYLPESLNIKAAILGLFKDLTPNSGSYKLIVTIVNEILKKHVGVFSFGFILVMFYSSNAMIGIIRTFDKSIAEKKKFFLHVRVRALRLTLILMLLIILSMVLMIGQDELVSILKKFFHFKKNQFLYGWNVIRWLIIVAITFSGISIIYKYAPSIKKRWKIVSPGSVLATALTLLTTIGFSYWVNHFANYNKIYGSIGTMLIFMALIYLNSLILLIGFELNVSITYLQAEAEKKKVAS
jgi:Predicted membrane protein